MVASAECFQGEEEAKSVNSQIKVGISLKKSLN